MGLPEGWSAPVSSREEEPSRVAEVSGSSVVEAVAVVAAGGGGSSCHRWGRRASWPCAPPTPSCPRSALCTAGIGGSFPFFLKEV